MLGENRTLQSLVGAEAEDGQSRQGELREEPRIAALDSDLLSEIRVGAAGQIHEGSLRPGKAQLINDGWLQSPEPGAGDVVDAIEADFVELICAGRGKDRAGVVLAAAAEIAAVDAIVVVKNVIERRD